MITVCPNCSLALAVTASDLRAGQGVVRCSRCEGLFSALPTLRDAGEPVPSDLRPSIVSPAVLAPFAPPSDEPPYDAETAADLANALEFDPRRADVASVFVEPKGTIIVVDESIDAAPHADGEPEVAVELEPVEVVEVVSSPAGEAVEPPVAGIDIAADHEAAGDDVPAAVDAAEAGEPAVVEDEGDAPADDEPAADLDIAAFGSQAPPPPRWHRPALVAAAVALVVLLGAQVVTHFRHDLATRPGLHGPLTSIFGTIGLPVVPRWDVRGYDVRQLGAVASTSGDGQLAVRMSVLNGAKVAQPAPLLRVNVQDRYGNVIARRDVPPSVYLPASLRTSGFLQAGQRLDTEVRFVDPGPAAVGFEIDACVPSAEQSLACASGAR